MKGYLILKDGSIFEGGLRGYKKEVEGEIVFNTGMVGYEKTLTDPSYFGQILVFTYPLIGNYGIGSDFESDKIQVRAVAASEICSTPSNLGGKIEEWANEFKIPILTGIDTRRLTEKIRNYGTLMGGIFFNKNILKQSQKTLSQFWSKEDINKKNLVEYVSSKEVKTYSVEQEGKPEFRVILYDCGVKLSIIKELLKRKIEVIRVPFDFDFQNLKEKFDGIVISNGPGDPQMADVLIRRVKELVKLNFPILGICLGNQILALALGAKTYKLKFGHRGGNQPVQDLKTKKCYITSQNHSFTVDKKTLPLGVKVWFENLNDETCEGIYHTKYPLLGVQFHPEANPGPMDTNWIFDLFFENLRIYASKKS